MNIHVQFGFNHICIGIKNSNLVKDIPMIIHVQFRFSQFISLPLIIFVVSEKKAFEHFHIGTNVNLCIAVVAILDFRSA